MSTIDLSALSLLREVLSPEGSIHLPGDPDYSNKRWAVNAEKNAAAVAWPATPEDVAQVLAFAQGKAPYTSQKRLHVAVKGGGHTPSGASSSDGGLVIDLQPKLGGVLAFAQGKAPYTSQKRLHVAVKGGGHTPSGASSSDGGLVIDLQPKLGGVRVNPAEKLAYVGGGALWRDVDEATTPYGLASVAGTVGHTGVGGLTLGGGFGWLTGNHGLVIDNLTQATVVTSPGSVLTASASKNPDLFWAIRGGGGNFGVVTEFVLKVHPQNPEVFTSTLTFLPGLLDRIVPEINAWLLGRTPSEIVYIIFANPPEAQPLVLLQFVYTGEPKMGYQKLERFTKLGAINVQTEVIPYMKLNHMNDPLVGHGLHRMLQGNFVPDIPEGLPVPFVSNLFSAWVKFITDHPPAASSVVALEFHHHGKISSVPPDVTAYAHRNPAHNVMFVITWMDPGFNELARGATLDLNQAFTLSREEHFPSDLVGRGGYTNYMDEESRIYNKEFTQRRFGANYSRLMELKSRYDPSNIFGRWIVEPQVTSGENNW
ncbi:unnamed protein product [Rhizoctonia solani]|uniref:FAD-binding PCMH-type domain-containing protein n=1 Tax=Rhizoctonia solani TaxID=456999 RepID=A0A8H2XIZ2_9AGAM|nr:unnamed protein product [Rhizoctonia solani]